MEGLTMVVGTFVIGIMFLMILEWPQVSAQILICLNNCRR